MTRADRRASMHTVRSPSPTVPAAQPDQPDQRSRRRALYVLCAGMLMIVLDVTVVNVALPYIQDDLGFSSSDSRGS